MSSTIYLPISSSFKVQVSEGEKISPKTILAEYKPSFEEKTIHLAKLLNVNPSQILKYLKKRVGENIGAGEVIAEKKRLFSSAVVKSPISGEIKEIDLKKGTLLFLQESENLKKSISFPISGRVISIGKSLMEIEINNPLYKAVKGEGNETSGKLVYLGGESVEVLDVDDDIDGSVVLVKSTSEAALVKFEVMGAVGLVWQKMIRSADLPWLQVEESTFKKLADYADKKVWLRPETKEIIILDKYDA